MDKDLIDRIYEMKCDMETCEETLKDVSEAGTKYITVEFDTWGLKHPLGKTHKVKFPTSFLMRILEISRDDMEEAYNNMLNILKGEKD